MLISLLNGEISQESYLIYNNARIIKTPLPRRIYGLIFRYKDTNIILVNRYTSSLKQKRTILHELAHLELNHLDNKKRLLEFKIENLEDEADEYIERLLEKISI